MRKKKHLFPAFTTIIGKGTELVGEIRFLGGLHVDGRVVGDVIAAAEDSCAVSLSASGTIEGNLEVPHAVLDGTVVGDVRASQRAELASGARIEGTLYYGILEMDEGAEVNGKLVHIDDTRQPPLRLEHQLAPGGASEAESPLVSSGNVGNDADGVKSDDSHT
jgi:cytoskeletal protein CcmA (bactofilin family)